MHFGLSSARATFVAASALGSVLAACIGPPQAQAQFVCIGNATGTTTPPGPADGAGATLTILGNNVACGPSANAVGANGTNEALGASANASGNVATNVAVGASANASGNLGGNTAIGFKADASGIGSNNVAIGNQANANGGVGTDNVAVGFKASATGINTTAMGNGATAAFDNSAAFGNGAGAARANQQVFGTATNTYTMTGITSAASQTAQSGALQLVTTDAGGNLAGRTAASLGLASTTDVAAINSQIGGINSQLSTINSRLGAIDAHLGLLDTRLNDLRTETRRGIASALAANSFTTPIRRGGTTVGVTGGFFQGESAVGVSVAHRVYAVPNLVVYGAYGNGGGGNTNSGKVGASLEF
jgi:autotransporter adhesin